jgi:hypothetical protein
MLCFMEIVPFDRPFDKFICCNPTSIFFLNSTCFGCDICKDDLFVSFVSERRSHKR